MVIDSQNIVGVIAVSGVFIFPFLAYGVHTVATNWRRVRVAEQQAVLSRELLERGLSPEEIALILSAGTGAENDCDLSSSLIENGYPAEQIGQLAEALDRVPVARRAVVMRDAVAMVEGGYSGADILTFLNARISTDLPLPT